MITSRRSGDLVLGPRSAGCAGVGRVPLDGATLVVDPAEPGLLGQLTIFDPDLAGPLLDRLLWCDDPSVSATALLLPAPRQGEGVSAAPELSQLLRLGVLLWLDAWSPDDLDPLLLDLEIGHLAAAAELLADGAETARGRLLPRVPELLARLEALRGGAGADLPADLPAELAVLRSALHASHDLMDASDADFDEVEHAYELDAVLDRAGTVRLDWDDRSLLVAAHPELLGGRELERAGHAGTEENDDRERSGRSSVDWQQVPRGVLDTAESTIGWTFDKEFESVAVTVTAKRAPIIADAEGRGALAFRVVGDDGSILGVGPLTYAAAAGTFVGAARSDHSSAMQVDVFDPTLTRPPRTGAAAMVGRAERWAVRSISLLRLALGAGDSAEFTRADRLLQYSTRMMDSAVAGAPAKWRDPLRGRQAQLLDNLYALADVRGRDAVRRRAEATLARIGRRPRSFVPAAELSAAEWALLTPGSTS